MTERAHTTDGRLTIRPLVEADRRAAARIYVTGLFDEEVWPIMPRHAGRAEAVFAELIKPSPSSWVAESDRGELVGVALCQESRGSPSGMVSWRVLRRHLPFAAAIRALIVCRYLYGTQLRDDETYLQSLAVADHWQGHGVGGALVSFVCDQARDRGYGTVTLNVVDGNERARRLYERLGFTTVRLMRITLYRPLVGFAAAYSMERRLAPNPRSEGG